MNVLPVTSYSYRYPVYNRQRTTNPNFKGGTPKPEGTIKVAENLKEFMTIVEAFKKGLGPDKTLSFQFVPEEKVSDFIGKDANGCNLAGKVGLRFLVTDTSAVEDVSDKIKLLMPKSCFGRQK